MLYEVITFRAMKDLDDTYGEFQDLVRERMRVFLADNNLHNLSAWFESEKRLNYINNNQKIINPEDLVKISKNPEFQQLLLEASLKVNETITVFRITSYNVCYTKLLRVLMGIHKFEYVFIDIHFQNIIFFNGL